MAKHKIRKIKHNKVELFSWIFLSVMTVIFLFPMFMAVMVSVSSRDSILNNGFQLIPEEFSLEAYRLLFTGYGKSLFHSLALTVGTGLLQPLCSVFLCMCMAYPMSQPDFKGKKFWRIFLLITMLFNAGLVPNYILRTQYLHLKNNILIYLIPGIGAWTVFLFRTFFMNLDKAMIESAKIDGASKFQILMRIMIPLTKPLVAMSFFSGFLGRWNDITTPVYYVTKRELFTLQYLLQQMLMSAQNARDLIAAGLPVTGEVPDIPIDSTRFALAVIGAVPVLILFPYIQKYYAKGIMVGSTKG